MSVVKIGIRRYPHGEGLPLPEYMTSASAGMDLMAANDSPIELAPGEFQKIPTGIAIALPEGYEAQIRPRSGLAAKYGVTLVNAPGTIDADYRGEIGVILINLGKDPFMIRRGDRIAQMVVAPVIRVSWELRETLDETQRGEGGFGHTGVGSKLGASTNTVS